MVGRLHGVFQISSMPGRDCQREVGDIGYLDICFHDISPDVLIHQLGKEWEGTSSELTSLYAWNSSTLQERAQASPSMSYVACDIHMPKPNLAHPT
jgi:hypothetical protein